MNKIDTNGKDNDMVVMNIRLNVVVKWRRKLM